MTSALLKKADELFRKREEGGKKRSEESEERFKNFERETDEKIKELKREPDEKKIRKNLVEVDIYLREGKNETALREAAKELGIAKDPESKDVVGVPKFASKHHKLN